VQLTESRVFPLLDLFNFIYYHLLLCKLRYGVSVTKPLLGIFLLTGNIVNIIMSTKGILKGQGHEIRFG